MSRLALTPTNVPASATDISIPTLRAGDLYYNTSDGWTAKGHPFFFPTLGELTNELDRSFLLRIASPVNGAMVLG